MRKYQLLITFAIVSLLCTGTANSQDRQGFSINAGIGASVIRDEDGAETFRDEGFGWTLGF